ncbi:DUF883 family protein [Caulobacter sp. DWR1-3-2b1]|uniref:DUF883 family protein n=1 Tax=Caulobacter sp. DWR1-3-2b1 TaxID=2804670 RepID=UPI003CE954E8
MDEQFNGALDIGVGRVENAEGALTGDVKTQVKGKLKEAAGAAKQAVGQLKSVANDAFGDAQHRVHDAALLARDQAKDRFSQAETYVRDKPGPALAITLAIGLVIGLVLRGPSSRTVYLRDR